MQTASEWTALTLSLWVALWAVVLSLPLGIGFGWLLARRHFRGKTLVDTFVNLPLVVPPVITGYLLLTMFGQQGVIGGWLNDTFGVRIVFDWKGAALASAVIAFPLMVRSIRTSFESVDRRLEKAARTLGAGPVDTFFSVTLPLARRGIIAGCVLAFARSLGEFGATIMIAGNIEGETRTIPLYIYNELQRPGGEQQIMGVVVVSVVVSAVALYLCDRLEGTTEDDES